MTENIQNSPPVRVVDEELDFFAYLMTIWQWKRIPVSIFVMAIVISVIYVSVLKPVYIAKVTLIPSDKSSGSNLGMMTGFAATFGLSLPVSGGDPSAVFGEIAKSRSFLKDFIKDTLPTIEEPAGMPLKNYFKINTADQDSATVSLAGKLAGMIEYESMDNIIELSVEDKDPVLAAALANRVVDRLKVYNHEKRISKIKTNRMFVEERLQEIKKELKDARNALTAFRRKNQRINIDHAPHLYDQQQWLMQEVQAKQEVYLLLKKEFEVARIEEEKEKPFVEILDFAIPPDPTFKPEKKLLLIVVSICSIVFGCILALIADLLYRYRFFGDKGQSVLAVMKSGQD